MAEAKDQRGEKIQRAVESVSENLIWGQYKQFIKVVWHLLFLYVDSCGFVKTLKSELALYS